SNSVVQNQRAEALGRFVFFNGVTGFLGPIVGGFLYQSYGLSLPLMINIIGGLLVTFAIIFFIRETKDNALGKLLLSKIEK
ncbi:MAG: MFS transporter, partial [Candidatus Firestonebacteria bacterium]